MKQFIKRFVTGNPFTKIEGKFSVTKSGYKFNRNIFYGFIVVMLLCLGWVFYYVGFSTDYQIYFKCGEEQCINPFYEGELDFMEYQLNIPDRLKGECKASWCSEKYLPPFFEYGNKPVWIFRYSSLIVIACTFLMLVLNHVLYNRGFGNEVDKDSFFN